jgi:hypothetical protein
MKRSKKLERKLASRIRDWENMVNKSAELKKAFRKPGSTRKG